MAPSTPTNATKMIRHRKSVQKRLPSGFGSFSLPASPLPQQPVGAESGEREEARRIGGGQRV